MTRADFHKIFTAEVRLAIKKVLDNECVYYTEWHDLPTDHAVEITVKIYLEKHHAPQQKH